jgi:hypothetical protein
MNFFQYVFHMPVTSRAQRMAKAGRNGIVITLFDGFGKGV